MTDMAESAEDRFKGRPSSEDKVAFTSSEPVNSADLSSIALSSLIADRIPNQTKQTILYDDIYPKNPKIVETFTNECGAVIKIVEDQDSKDRLLIFTPSAVGNPEELVLKISRDKWSDDLASLVSRLTSVNSAGVSAIIEQIRPRVVEQFVFKERDPTSFVLESVLAKTAGQFSDLRMNRDPDRSVYDAVPRILSARGSVMVRFAEEQTKASRWKKMFISMGDHGFGSIVLCVGKRAVTSSDLNGESEDVGRGRAWFNLNLSSLDFRGKEEWLKQLLGEFSSSRDKFPGAIGSFLNKESVADSETSSCKVKLYRCVGMRKEHLDANLSAQYLNRYIQSVFKNYSLQVRETYNTGSECELECQNSAQDFLYLKVMPHGIEQIHVAPRGLPTPGTARRAVQFFLGDRYQLGDDTSRFINQLAAFFAKENGKSTNFRDVDGNALELCAQSVTNYLIGYVSPPEDTVHYRNLKPRFKIVTRQPG